MAARISNRMRGMKTGGMTAPYSDTRALTVKWGRASRWGRSNSNEDV